MQTCRTDSYFFLDQPLSHASGNSQQRTATIATEYYHQQTRRPTTVRRPHHTTYTLTTTFVHAAILPARLPLAAAVSFFNSWDACLCLSDNRFVFFFHCVSPHRGRFHLSHLFTFPPFTSHLSPCQDFSHSSSGTSPDSSVKSSSVELSFPYSNTPLPCF